MSHLPYSSPHPASSTPPPFLEPEGGSLQVSPTRQQQQQQSYSSRDQATKDVHLAPGDQSLVLVASARLLWSPATAYTWRARTLPARGHLAVGRHRLTRAAWVCAASCGPMGKGPYGHGQRPAERPMGARHANEQVRRRPARRVKAAAAQGMLEARWAAAEQTPGLRAASSGLPSWPPLGPPPPPSHPPRSSGAWRRAPAGSAAGPASTTSPTSCGTTRGANSCSGQGLARMLAPTWMGHRTDTRPTRAAGSSSTTWATCKETLRYSGGQGHTLRTPPPPTLHSPASSIHLPSRRTQGDSPRPHLSPGNRSLPAAMPPPTPGV